MPQRAKNENGLGGGGTGVARSKIKPYRRESGVDTLPKRQKLRRGIKRGETFLKKVMQYNNNVHIYTHILSFYTPIISVKLHNPQAQ